VEQERNELLRRYYLPKTKKESSAVTFQAYLFFGVLAVVAIYLATL